MAQRPLALAAALALATVAAEPRRAYVREDDRPADAHPRERRLWDHDGGGGGGWHRRYWQQQPVYPVPPIYYPPGGVYPPPVVNPPIVNPPFFPPPITGGGGLVTGGRVRGGRAGGRAGEREGRCRAAPPGVSHNAPRNPHAPPRSPAPSPPFITQALITWFASPLCNQNTIGGGTSLVLVTAGVCNVVPAGAVASTSYQVLCRADRTGGVIRFCANPSCGGCTEVPFNNNGCLINLPGLGAQSYWWVEGGGRRGASASGKEGVGWGFAGHA